MTRTEELAAPRMYELALRAQQKPYDEDTQPQTMRKKRSQAIA